MIHAMPAGQLEDMVAPRDDEGVPLVTGRRTSPSMAVISLHPRWVLVAFGGSRSHSSHIQACFGSSCNHRQMYHCTIHRGATAQGGHTECRRRFNAGKL